MSPEIQYFGCFKSDIHEEELQSNKYETHLETVMNQAHNHYLFIPSLGHFVFF